MNVYVYQAALLCEECGEAERQRIHRRGQAPVDWDDEPSYDSDAFPKGPYPDGGGEADAPNHCDHCGVFLENPLTSEGEEYVKRVLRNDSGTEVRFAADCLPEWRERYSYLFREES